MTDPADFLSRWSRRKREAAKARPDKVVEQTPAPERKLEGSGNADALPDSPEKKKESPVAAAAKPEEPVVDITKLPSLDSITAETDMRPFLARGVPASLRQAALRSVWAADPKIRDFIELAENQWDFNNAPAEILGFDFSPPTGDIKKMVADVYGKLPANESEIEAQSEMLKAGKNVPNTVPTNRAIDSHRNVTGTLSGNEEGDAAAPNPTELPNDPVRQTLVAQRNEENIAPQKNDAAQDSEIESRPRPHGRAMPK